MNRTFKSNRFSHQLRKLSDTDFLSGPNVDMAVTNFVFILNQVLKIHFFHHKYGGIGHLFAPQKFTHGSSRSPELKCSFRDTIFFEQHSNLLIGCTSIHSFNRSFVQIFTDGLPVFLLKVFCQVGFPNHGRQYMASFQVKVVIWSVQISRHYGNEIGSVLNVEAFAHFQSGNFGNGIRLVGVFQRPGEQRIFLHGLRSIARIDAGATQKNQFLDVVTIACAYNVVLNLQIPVDEIGTIHVVCNNSAHMSSCQNDVFGFFGFKKFFYPTGVHQVQFFYRSANQMGESFAFEVFPDCRAYQSAMSGYVYF